VKSIGALQKKCTYTYIIKYYI